MSRAGRGSGPPRSAPRRLAALPPGAPPGGSAARAPVRSLAVGLALVAACSGGSKDPGSGSAPGTAPPARIVFVTHGQASDPFWSTVAGAAEDAGEDLGVTVEYQAPTSFDMVAMAERIEAAVASRPDGLVVSIPDADALGGSIRRAVEAGIPVVSINSGGEAWRALGLEAHVGQSERDAGVAAGRRMADAGVARALCVNHEVGNLALDARCDGFREGLGGTVDVLPVDLADPEDARQRIAGALAAREGVDGILTLGPTGAEPALAALRETGRADGVTFATFDLSPGVLDALEAGRALFAVDQQPYLQGYLPVVLLHLLLETGTMPGGGEPIRTGPGFVTREEAARVRDLAGRGIR